MTHPDTKCVVCGRRLGDPTLLRPGLFGVPVHRCPPAVEAAHLAAETRAANGPEFRLPPYGQMLLDGFSAGWLEA